MAWLVATGVLDTLLPTVVAGTVTHLAVSSTRLLRNNNDHTAESITLDTVHDLVTFLKENDIEHTLKRVRERCKDDRDIMELVLVMTALVQQVHERSKFANSCYFFGDWRSGGGQDLATDLVTTWKQLLRRLQTRALLAIEG